MAYPGGRPWSGENPKSVEMAAKDIIGLVDFSAGEFKIQEYSTFQSFLLKTNEDRIVNANISFRDDKKLYFGDSNDLEIFHSNPNNFIKSTKIDGKLDIILTTSGPSEKTLMSLDPDIGTNGAIIFDDTFLNHAGVINTGIQFQATRVFFHSNIKMQSNFINNDGVDNKGLSFGAAGNAEFDQDVTVHGEGIFNDKIRANENIDLALNFINGDGADGKGLTFAAAGHGTFKNNLIVDGTLSVTGSITGSNTGTFTGKLRTNNVFNVSGNDGISQGFASFPTLMTFTGGILTGWTP